MNRVRTPVLRISRNARSSWGWPAWTRSARLNVSAIVTAFSGTATAGLHNVATRSLQHCASQPGKNGSRIRGTVPRRRQPSPNDPSHATAGRCTQRMAARRFPVPPGDVSPVGSSRAHPRGRYHARTCGLAECAMARVVDIAGRLLTAATATGGPAFAVFNPPHERPGDPPGVLLFNRLAALRYHRSDAHAAAWAARGLTAAEIVALPADTPLRQDIEADTNRRAALPYEALPPNERLRFLAELAALA